MRTARVTVLTGTLAGSLLAAGLAVASPASAVAAVGTGTLRSGATLVAPNGAYRATFDHGRLVVRTRAGRPVWATSARPTPATAVVLDPRGNLRLTDGARTLWSSRTSSAGRSVLALGNDGRLSLTSSRLLVWDSRVGNACPRTRGKTFVVDVSSQFARMCANGQQIRATPVTTGASAKGFATPTGRWRVYAKQRNATLRPSTGGAFKVRYWVPYDGPYGVHDARWQTFAYGSAKYRTGGSHGCTRTPLAAMKFFFGWAQVGTRVVVKR